MPMQDRLDAVSRLAVGGQVRGDQLGDGEYGGQARVEHRPAEVVAGAQ